MAKKKKKKKGESTTTPTPRLKILDIGFGVLNPISDTLTSKNFDSSDTSMMDLMRQTVISNFQADTFQGTGPYVGIVLRDEGLTSTNIRDPQSWVAGPFNHRVRFSPSESEEGGINPEKISNLPPLRQIRVRIPEIHAALPIPTHLPPRSRTNTPEDNEAHKVINLYPVFVAQDSDMSQNPIRPGSLVWVDFQNRNTLQGGIFLSEISNVDPEDEKKSTGGSKTTLDPYRACIEEGYSPEECAVFNVGNVIYQSGGAVSNIGISRASTTINQGSGFPYSLLNTLEQNKKQIENLREDEKFSGMVTGIRNGSYLISNRPALSAYGYPEPSQVEDFKGDKVHKLLIPRLEALNDMWTVYQQNILGAKKATGGGEWEIRYALTEGKSKPGKKAVEPFRLSQSFAVGQYNNLSAEKVKSWIKGHLLKYGKFKFNTKAYPLLSKHAMGLAFDINSSGLQARGASAHGYEFSTASAALNSERKIANDEWCPQYDSPLYIFLLKYGWLFGLVPYAYKGEPWHWEFTPPRQAWKDCTEFAMMADGYDNATYGPFYTDVGYTPITVGDIIVTPSSTIPETSGGEYTPHSAGTAPVSSISGPVTESGLIVDRELGEIYYREFAQMGYPDSHQFPYAVHTNEISKQRTSYTLNKGGNLDTKSMVLNFLSVNGGVPLKDASGNPVVDEASGTAINKTYKQIGKADIPKIMSFDKPPSSKIKWFATAKSK